MDLDYKNKYLKYKMKYLILQQQVGSNQTSQTFTSIIVTHNGRMRCLLDTLGISKPLSDIDTKEKKFKNCAVLKLIIDPTNINAELIVSGELAAGDGKETNYFTSLNKTVSNISVSTYGHTFIFYIIRHGHGRHNLEKDKDAQNIVTKTLQINKALSSASGIIKDAELTTEKDQKDYPKIMSTNGEAQAVKAGKELSSKLIGSVGSVGFLFASDLKRTRQTLYKLLEGADLQIINPSIITVTILPCAHELDYNQDGCDGHQGITATENVMNCTIQTTCSTVPGQNDYCSSIPTISTDPNSHNLCLNWDFYKAFYEGSRKTQKSKNQCRKTNMLQQAIFTILSRNIEEYKDMVLKEQK
jgi:broad specificity phosphatase PhoE